MFGIENRLCPSFEPWPGREKRDLVHAFFELRIQTVSYQVIADTSTNSLVNVKMM